MPEVSPTTARRVDLAADGFHTVRCSNERCRHIVFRYRRDTVVAGGVVIEVKCSCNTINTVRLLARTTH